MTIATPVSVPLQHSKVTYIQNAVADGFEVFSGPWGNNANDWSVDLVKEDPILNGKFLIRLVERNLIVPWEETSLANSSVSAWFITSSEDNGTSSREQSLKILADVYDYAELSALANSCTICGKEVGLKNLTHVSFASAACKDCL